MCVLWVVVDQMGVQQFVLAGNSRGQIAWGTAVAHPQRVKKLVLIDSAGYPLQSTSVPLGFTIARTPGSCVVMEYVLPRGVVQSSVRNVYGDPAKVTADLVGPVLRADSARRQPPGLGLPHGSTPQW